MWGDSRSTPWPAGDLVVGAQLGLWDCVGDGGVADVAARLWPWGGEGVPPNGVHRKLSASMLLYRKPGPRGGLQYLAFLITKA